MCKILLLNWFWNESVTAYGETTVRGEPIPCGGKIRLQHLKTRSFLHSHHFPAPLSKSEQVRLRDQFGDVSTFNLLIFMSFDSQEISAFGNDNESDTGDNWIVNCNGDE